MNSVISRSQVLYIGNDPLLSKSASALLRSAGYRVRSTNPNHVAEATRDGHYLAVILCATLSSLETVDAVDALRQTQPNTPIVSIHVGLLGDSPHPASAVVVDALGGPQALISAVYCATHPRKRSHADS